jgi:hypothetical protein
MPVGGRDIRPYRAQALFADLVVNDGVELVVTELISGLGRPLNQAATKW